MRGAERKVRDREMWRERIKLRERDETGRNGQRWAEGKCEGRKRWRGQRDRDWGSERDGGTGVDGVRMHMRGVAIPEPVPQRGHLTVHGLSRLCDILQLTLQPPAPCLSPGCLLLSLLQLSLQLLHSKVPLLQLGGSREAQSCLWVPYSSLILLT